MGDPARGVLYAAYTQQCGIMKLDINSGAKLGWAVAASTDTFGVNAPQCGFGGDGQAAAGGQDVKLSVDIRQITVDSTGNLYIADAGNGRVRKVEVVSKKISTIAGNGASMQFTGDQGPATKASLWQPSGLAVTVVDDVRGVGGKRKVLYIADTGTLLLLLLLSVRYQPKTWCHMSESDPEFH